MTQHSLILKYIEQFGSITPARLSDRDRGFISGEFIGSQADKRCRELWAKGVLERVNDGKFKKFYLKQVQKPLL